MALILLNKMDIILSLIEKYYIILYYIILQIFNRRNEEMKNIKIQ